MDPSPSSHSGRRCRRSPKAACGHCNRSAGMVAWLTSVGRQTWARSGLGACAAETRARVEPAKGRRLGAARRPGWPPGPGVQRRMRPLAGSTLRAGTPKAAGACCAACAGDQPAPRVAPSPAALAARRGPGFLPRRLLGATLPSVRRESRRTGHAAIRTGRSGNRATRLTLRDCHVAADTAQECIEFRQVRDAAAPSRRRNAPGPGRQRPARPRTAAALPPRRGRRRRRARAQPRWPAGRPWCRCRCPAA